MLSLVLAEVSSTILSAIISAIAVIAVGILGAYTAQHQSTAPPAKSVKIANNSLDIVDVLSQENDALHDEIIKLRADNQKLRRDLKKYKALSYAQNPSTVKKKV